MVTQVVQVAQVVQVTHLDQVTHNDAIFHINPRKFIPSRENMRNCVTMRHLRHRLA